MAVFMTERRAKKERLRSQQRAIERRHARFRQKHGRSPPLEAEHVKSLPPTPEQLQIAYESYCTELHIVQNSYTWQLFLKDGKNEKRRRAYAARRAEQHGPQKKRGRPADPEVARRHEEQKQLQQQRIEERRSAIAPQRGTGRNRRGHSHQRSHEGPGAWSTEGQCAGKTRDGERCKVHRTSPYAVAAPLRRGERFCGHHHPDKYTGVRCAGIKKHGKGQCRVWSGSCYADASPLRRGSPFCHHHRVRCQGTTRTSARCTVTSSSEHAHADPLRQGKQYCVHHTPQTYEPCCDAAESEQSGFSVALGAADEDGLFSDSDEESESGSDCRSVTFSMALGAWDEEREAELQALVDDESESESESESSVGSEDSCGSRPF